MGPVARQKRAIANPSANVLQPNRNTAALLALIERERPDLVVLCEVNDRWLGELASLKRKYRHHVEYPLDNMYGIALYTDCIPPFDANSLISRYPLDYLFHSNDFRVVGLKRLPFIGSDHYPLLVELSYEPDARATQEAPQLDRGDREDAQEAVEAVDRKGGRQ